MGIQINGNTDTISATDGSLVVSGAELPAIININASGIITATNGFSVGTGASVFSPTTNELALGTNGSERVRVDSSGDLILKTSGTMSVGKFVFREGSDDAFSIRTTGANGAIEIYDEWDDATRLHIDTSGNFGIGSDNPAEKLDVFQNAADNIIAQFQNANTNSGNLLKFTQVTNGSVTNPIFYIGQGGDNSGNALLLNNANTDMVFSTNNAERARILAAGGLTFNGDTAAANALDDYEEGTFTFTLYDSDTGGNASPTTVTGHYTKIGDLVFVSVPNLNNISTSGMTGVNDLWFSLPFTASSSQNGAIGSPLFTSQMTFQSGVSYYAPRVDASKNRGLITGVRSGNTAINMAVSTLTSGTSDFGRLTLVYKTA